MNVAVCITCARAIGCLDKAQHSINHSRDKAAVLSNRMTSGQISIPSHSVNQIESAMVILLNELSCAPKRYRDLA